MSARGRRLALMLALALVTLAASTLACDAAPAAPLPEERSGIAATPEALPEEASPGQAHLRWRFADAEEGAALLLGNEAYVRGFSAWDLAYRLQRENGTAQDWLALAAAQTRDFTPEETEAVSRGMDFIQRVCAVNGYALPECGEIVFVKTTMAEECGAGAYTHGAQIYLGERALAAMTGGDEALESYGRFVLAHELFHVLTRAHPEFRAEMYALLGFVVEAEEFAFSPEIAERLISNPDVQRHDAHATFIIDGRARDCVVVFTASRPFQRPGDSFFELGVTGLVPVDDPGALYFAEDAENFWEVFGRNTDYVIDPEEALADNFAYALIYGETGMDYPTPAIIRGILGLLER